MMSWRALSYCLYSEHWLWFARFLDIRESDRHLFGKGSVPNSLLSSSVTNARICSRESSVWICSASITSFFDCRFLYLSADRFNQIRVHVCSMTHLWPQQQHWQLPLRRIRPATAIVNRHTVVSRRPLHLEVQQAWRLKRVMAWIKRMQWLEPHPHSASRN
jgi:hypothetical protein